MSSFREGSVASIASSGQFMSDNPSRGGAVLGVALWVGEGDSSDLVRLECVAKVVKCNQANFIEIFTQQEWVVTIVFADQPLDVIQELSKKARDYVYNMGIGIPVYAATVEDKAAAFRVCDVVVGISQWKDLADKLCQKLVSRAVKTDVLWCDRMAKSPLMRQMVSVLGKLGLNVILFEDAESLVRAASENTAAVIVSSQGIPALNRIREKLHDNRARPLYWIVSLSLSMESAYDNGADAAIVVDNPNLQIHKQHLKNTYRNQPWMWQVVLGDLVAIFQSTGVTGLGGVQWSMPKLYDNLEWRVKNLPLLVRKSELVFTQLAEVKRYKIVKIGPNPRLNDHEARFQAAKNTLKGYVRDRVVYHGTSVDAAQKILAGNFRASGSGMYGPGVYSVDPTGLSKAEFFAFSRRGIRDPNDRDARENRNRGAIIALRIAMCNTRIVSELPGGNWYKSNTPCSDGEESLIGVVRAGYNGIHAELNEIAEYVIRESDLCVPLGLAVFEKEGAAP